MGERTSNVRLLRETDEEVTLLDKVVGLLLSTGDASYRRMTLRQMHSRGYVETLIADLREAGEDGKANRLFRDYNNVAKVGKIPLLEVEQ